MKKTIMTLILLASSTSFADRLETLRGYTAADGVLQFEVTSTGCTDKNDFRLEVEHSYHDANNWSAQLYRVNEDSCEALEHGVIISYDVEDLGLSPGENLLHLDNPIKVPPARVYIHDDK